MPAPKKPAAPKAAATKKATDTTKKTPAAAKKTTTPATKPEQPTPPPAPTLSKIMDKDVVRIWLKGRKGCWVGVIKKVTADELTFCVRWHKDSPPIQVKRADVTKLEVKVGAKYAEVAGV